MSPHSKDCLFYLTGRPISKSMSPRFHNTIFQELGLPWEFQLLESSDPDELRYRMRDESFGGASVTMPYKTALLNSVDELDEVALCVGALNCIFIRVNAATNEKQLIGTNTDCMGIRDAVVHHHPKEAATIAGRPAAVLGGGGASRAAVFAMLKLLDASVVYLINRDPQEVEDVIKSMQSANLASRCIHVHTLDQAQSLAPAAMIVGTIPDLEPRSEDEKRVQDIASTLMRSDVVGIFLDMCYTPSPDTGLIKLAERANWTTIRGNEVFFHQALAQAALWTGKDVEDLPIEAAKNSIAL